MTYDVLYKYRALEPFKYLADILLKRRLYAARYFDLNDPMEGQYTIAPSGGIDEDIVRSLEGRKRDLRICSLSRTPDNPLMWAHYAGGNRGVVLGVRIDDNRYRVHRVDYGGLASIHRSTLNSSSAEEILTHKLEAWEYEEEERVFTSGGYFVSVELTEIILGSRMSNQDKSLLQELCGKLCPDVPIRSEGRNV